MKKWQCAVCGEVFEGDTPPDPCPVCGVGAENMMEVTGGGTPAVEKNKPATPAPQVASGAPQWRCVVCGQIFDGEAPPVPCPICGAGEEAFEKLEGGPAGVQTLDSEDKYLLVGGGMAALEAAKAIRKRNKTAEITMVAGEGYLPYNRPALSDVVCGGAACDTLYIEQAAFYEDNRIELLCGVTVESVDGAAKTARLSDGSERRYTKLLLATGSNPFNPIQSGPDTIPVKVLRRYEDAQELFSIPKRTRVVLVGGGILGLEAAQALHNIGCEVTVVEFAPRIMPLQCDEEASRRLQAALEAMGIVVLTGQSVSAATATGVVLASGAEMAADIVLASMGVRSEVTLAKQLGLNVGRGIVVDEFMHTSAPDVWAAGDCAEFGGRVQALVGAASAMGSVAGASMAGDEGKAYEPFTPATALDIPGFSLFSIGETETQETVLHQNEDTGSYRRLFFRDGALTGALFLGSMPGVRAVGAVANGWPLKKALELL